MKRKCLAVGIILLFIGTTIIPSSGQKIEKQSLPGSRGNILYVGGNGPGNYTTIQSAINAASPGDTVFVYDDSSPYNEYVVVNKAITLLGENKNSTIINGSQSQWGIEIKASGIVLQGFTIQNCYEGVHIDDGFSQIIISDNFFIRHQFAIIGWLCNDSLIIRNIFFENDVAILLSGSNNTISENYFKNNSFSIQGGGCWVYVPERKPRIGYHDIISKNIIIMLPSPGITPMHGIYVGAAFSCNVSYNMISGPVSSGNFSKKCIGIRTEDATNTSFFMNDISNFSHGIVIEYHTSLGPSFLLPNRIICNNFINNLHHASIHTYKYKINNIWSSNYWGRPRRLPKFIICFQGFLSIQFD